MERDCALGNGVIAEIGPFGDAVEVVDDAVELVDLAGSAEDAGEERVHVDCWETVVGAVCDGEEAEEGA